MQLHLFPQIIKEAYLEADSPKKAFYRLILQECQGNYILIKESGCQGRVMDRREWVMPSYEKAIKKFEGLISWKTNPARGSPRVYKQKRRRR